MPFPAAHRSAFALGLLLCGLALNGQVLEPQDCRASGTVLPYPPLREADVMWERRVWRTLDLHDPQNAALLTPQGKLPGCRNLFAVMQHGLKDEGGLVAYQPDAKGEDDAFRKPFLREEIKSMLAAVDTLPATAVARFMIKEDWIFDRARSVMEVRIIGIAPMIEVRGEEGELRGYRPLYWLYYPECRHLLAWWTAITGKDGERVSYEELFAQRRFSGTIVKVSNMQDRAIAGHTTGLDALLESEEVRQQLLHMGFDLWNY